MTGNYVPTTGVAGFAVDHGSEIWRGLDGLLDGEVLVIREADDDAAMPAIESARTDSLPPEWQALLTKWGLADARFPTRVLLCIDRYGTLIMATPFKAPDERVIA